MFALKDYITSEDIKNLRKNLGLTQKEFASLVGTSKPTIDGKKKMLRLQVQLFYFLR